jgi:hypothetical protein
MSARDLGVAVAVTAVFALGLALTRTVEAQAEPVGPAPTCTKLKSFGGLNPNHVATWMAEQQAQGRGRFIVPAADAGYSVICAY